MNECQHSRQELRRKGFQAVFQCLDCGRYIRAQRSTRQRTERLPEFDVAFLESEEAKRKKAYEDSAKLAKTKFKAMLEVESARWWQWYDAYLKTTEWDMRRQAVLRRDPICKACESMESVQVHHLTYAHVGNEPLFDLVGVCRDCHEKITAMDREARQEA